MTKSRNRKLATDSRPDATQQDSVTASTNAVFPRQSKAALLRAMLETDGGASLARIMAETGWQAHTVRAALSGLRKAGAQLTLHRAGDDTIYVIGVAGLDAPEGSDEVDGECGEPDTASLPPIAGDPGTDSTGEGVAASEVRA